jgi:phosphatidylethanolamine/phosphatidyl-N-methylethanolamine N-methyltransferase
MAHLKPAQADRSAEGASQAAYSRWAPIYDLIFDWPFHPGRLAAARAASAAAGSNGAILVVGVGTGLELGLLRKDSRVTGIDLSQPMLRLARERVARKHMAHVRDLRVMDASALAFPDNCFDSALAPYVLSVVPQPARVLDEMWRVTRPGGVMVVMNHFGAKAGLRARVERAMEDAAAWLGWHPNFPYAVVGDWLASRPDAHLIERRELSPFRAFTMLRIEKTRAPG